MINQIQSNHQSSDNNNNNHNNINHHHQQQQQQITNHHQNLSDSSYSNHHHHHLNQKGSFNLNLNSSNLSEDRNPIQYQQQQQQASSSSSLNDFTFHNLPTSNPNYLDSYLDSTPPTTINQTFKPFQFQSQSSTEPLIFDPLTFDQFSNLFPNFNSSSTSNPTSNLQSALSHESDQHLIPPFSTSDHHDQLSINPNLLSPKIINNQSDYSNQAYDLSSLIQNNNGSISPSNSNSNHQLLQANDHFNQNQSSTHQITTKNQTRSPIVQSSPEPQHLIQIRKPSNDGLPDPKRKRTEQTSKPNSNLTDGSYNTFLEPSPIISSSSRHPNPIDLRNQECSTPNVNPSVFESNSNHQNQTPSEQGGSNLSNQYRSQYPYHQTSDQETPNQSTQYRSSIDQTSSPNPKPNSFTQQQQQQQHPHHHHLTHDFTKRKDWAKKVMEDVMDLCLLIDPDHRIKFVSSSLNYLTGYHHRDWIGSLILNWLFDEDDRVNFSREIEDCLKEMKKEIKFYCRIRKRDGTCLILEICGHTILSETKAESLQSIFISGRKYPSSASKLSDRIFDLRLENERLLKSLSLTDSSIESPSHSKEKVEEKQKKSVKVNKKSSVSKTNPNHQSSTKTGLLSSISSENEPVSEFVCKDCGTTISPEWRKGPTGPKTLCNACGLRWAKKAKPLNS